MNLIVDIGNSRTKLSVFEADEEVFATSVAAGVDWVPLVPWGRYPLDRAMLCSVREDVAPYVKRLAAQIADVRVLSAFMPLPVRVQYRTPETLGLDRLAAVCGAWKLSDGKACLVVDLGTAITYDFLTADGSYKGGNIAAGVRMRLAALHEHTSRLPLVAPSADFALLGDSTETALISGTMQGVALEIEGYACELSRDKDDICVFLTGGDAFYFEKRLKSRIFVSQNLVAVGLNAALQWNERK